MPRYFFRTVRNNVPLRPTRTLELPSLDGAWHEALFVGADMLRDLQNSPHVGTELTIELQDEARKTLRSVTMSVRSWEA
jgi:hypothetical protein